MPSAACYTNRIRFTSSIQDTKAQLLGNVGNLTQSTISGCALNIDYSPIEYIETRNCVNTCRPQPVILKVLPPVFPQHGVGLSLISYSGTILSLSVVAATNNPTYTVSWSPNTIGSSSSILLPSETSNTITFKIESLTAGVTYTVTLTATNSAGSDSMTETITVVA